MEPSNRAVLVFWLASCRIYPWDPRAAPRACNWHPAHPPPQVVCEALQRFLEHLGERLPVIESPANPVLLGVAAKSALLATYVRLSEV